MDYTEYRGWLFLSITISIIDKYYSFGYVSVMAQIE